MFNFIETMHAALPREKQICSADELFAGRKYDVCRIGVAKPAVATLPQCSRFTLRPNQNPQLRHAKLERFRRKAQLLNSNN